MIKRIFVSKSCISYFIYFIHFLFYFSLSKLAKFLVFSIYRAYNYQDCEQTDSRRGNKHFDVLLRRIRTVHFLSKGGKGASYDGRDGWKSCLFPARVGISDFDVLMNKVLFPICTLTWRVNNYVFHQEKV